ncbi:MAG: hypothetical protein ACO3PY_02670 [Pontimonas sp.]
MSSSEPKRPSFVRWLRTTGQITDGEYLTLNHEWQKAKRKNTDHKVFTTGPITWDQFVASKYPRKVLTYQAYLRVTGAAPTFKKD